MGTVNRLIQSEHDRSMAAKFVENRPYPFTLTVTDGAPRSKAQNRLLHKWMGEIAEQKGDCSPDEARAYCKLTIGVPILRSQNESFKERYDEILKPLSYEQKLAIMSEPLNLPVTSLMSTKQLTEYLEAIIRHFGEQGIVLTMPDDLKSNSGSDPQPDKDEDSPSSSQEPADPPPLAGSSPNPETELLIRYARDVLPMAADPEATGAALAAIEREYASGEFKTLSTEGLERAKAISRSMRAIFNNETTLASALGFYAEVLETTVENLRGETHG